MFTCRYKIENQVLPNPQYSVLDSYPEYSLPPVTYIASDGKEYEIVTGDVYNLFNQKRFEGVAQNIIDSIRSNIIAGGSQYQSVLDGLSDDELIRAIKPRSLQSPSELMEYSKRVMDYLDSRLSSQTENVSPDTITEDTNIKSD